MGFSSQTKSDVRQPHPRPAPVEESWVEAQRVQGARRTGVAPKLDDGRIRKGRPEVSTFTRLVHVSLLSLD